MMSNRVPEMGVRAKTCKDDPQHGAHLHPQSQPGEEGRASAQRLGPAPHVPEKQAEGRVIGGSSSLGTMGGFCQPAQKLT